MKSLKKTLSVFLSLLTILSMCSVSMPVFAAYDWKKDLQQIDDHYVQEEFSSKIVAEVEALREENTKHFLCEDGSYIATTYSEPVHYKENGEWKEIDNTLKLSNKVKSSSGKAMYVPKSTDTEVKIPQSFSDGQKISLTKKGHTISFGVSQDKNVKLSRTATVVNNIEELSSNVQPNKAELHNKTLITSTDSENYGEITKYNNEVVAIENQAGAIVYEDVFESADLEYVVTTNSIKENIVVYEKQNDYTYKFDMDFGDLVPIVNEDNSIRVVDPETEETVFFVGAPYMYDANDIESTDVDMSLVEEAGIYLLTLKASSEWINATERTFPVVIDPIVYLSFDDVFVMNGLLNKNTTKVNKELRVGRNLTNLTRTYIKPNYPTNIPMGSHIDSAYLILGQDNYYQAPGADGIYINLYDCHNVSSWNPGSITWENQPFYNADNGYVSSENCFLTSVLASSNKAEYSFNITASAKRWLRTGSNDGLMLASSDESEKTQIDFYSSRTSDSSLHPSLSIYYIEPSISATSWETDSQAKEGSLFRIATDNAWTAYSNENWISLSKTSGNGLDYSKIIVTANNSIFDRVGTVTVKMGDTVIGTITVTQYGKKPNLELDTTSLNFNAGSSKQIVNITSNTTWSFSNLPEWITVTPSEGSMNSTVEIEVSVNNDSDIRESNITVSADTVMKTINVAQLNDIEAPAKPDIYEEDGLVYISTRSFNFNEETDSPEHIEYKIENCEWIEYDGNPLNIVRTYGAKVYARVRDDAKNISPIAEITLENTLGEYTASYTDIALGEGLFPVEFGRTYTSTNGWFFTFDANIVKIDDNAYVFTGFYGEKQYFIKNSEGKYFSIDEDELTVNSDSYVLTYGDMICTFGLDGKINRIVTDYLDTVYNWSDNSLTLTNGATVTFTDGKPTKINIARTDSEGTEHTKEIEYVWVEGNLTRFIDAADVEHNYAYTNGLLTTNETETITYSAQGRVKMISQPNGSFVKYVYNDNAENSEILKNIGAVMVYDSKSVTDIWYYADGIDISNSLANYSDKAVYNPQIEEFVTMINSIQDDEIINTCLAYAAESFVGSEIIKNIDDGMYNANSDNSVESTSDEDNSINDNAKLFYIDSDVSYIFLRYDEKERLISEWKVSKENFTIDKNTTFERVESAAKSKITYEYIGPDSKEIKEEIYYLKVGGEFKEKDKYVYTYSDNNDLQIEEYYKMDKNNTLCRIFRFVYDVDGNLVSEQYFRQDFEEDDNIEVVYENYLRVYEDDNLKSEIYKTLIDGALTDTRKTLYDYDVGNKVTDCIVQEYILGSLRTSCKKNYEYDTYGNIKKETTTTYRYELNQDSNIIEEVLSDDVIEYEYNAWNQQTKVTESVNGVENTITTVVYDALGRVVSVVEDDETTAYVYDSKDNILTVTEGEEVTSYTYSANGNLISRTNPSGSVASYFYDSYGNLTNHTFNGYAFTYNTLGSILTANSGSGELVNYTYSDTIEQEVLTSNFGNGQSIVYDYNEDGEITAIKLGEETKYGYEYFETTDYNGEVTKEWAELTDYVSGIEKVIEESKLTVNDLNGNFIYSVENVSRDEEVEDSFNGTVTTIGSDMYTLVTEENKDTFKTNGTTDFAKEYTYVNDELSKTYTAGITTSYSYNADNLISILENTLNDVSQVYGYAYDENGNITTETLATTSKDENGAIIETNEAIHYNYDDKEQLISAETSSIKYEYTYDDRGNILTKKEYSISLDENNEKVYTLIENDTDTYAYDETWKDKLISYNGHTITYDAVGNPTNYMGNTLTWTMGRQLASFGNISYTYNEDGIRTSKISNGVTTKFLLDGYNIIEQTDGITTLHFFYDSNGEVIGFKYNGNDYFYVKNAMSDIIAITDSNKNIVVEYRYDPWGKVLDEDDLTAIGKLNPFRYRSYYYDSDIQMYYLLSRYYDAKVGRFINSDRVNYIGATESEVSYNPFAYCENNPIINWDPIGNNLLNKIKDILSSITAAISAFFATDTVSVFSIDNDAWMDSSETMGNALRTAANARKSTVIPTTPNNFADEWNKLRSKYVIIHTHGSPIGIYDESNPQQAIFTTADMENLKRNNKIRCLIITSCSVAGNAGERRDNFARAISRKINSKGVVIGCRFVVSGGDTFFEPASPNTNETQAWIIYRNGFSIDMGLPSRISMQIVYDYLVNNNYI